MSAKAKKRLWGAVILVGIIIVCAVFFRKQPMIRADNPDISYIGIGIGRDGKAQYIDLSSDDIPQPLREGLLSLFSDASVRRRVFPSGHSFSFPAGDAVSLDIKVLTDSGSFFVYLSTVHSYNFVDYHGTDYSIVNRKELYEDVYRLICETVPGLEP